MLSHSSVFEMLVVLFEAYLVLFKYGDSGQWGRSVRLTTHLHLAPRLTIRGAKILLLLYAFMACVSTILPSLFVTRRSSFQ